MTRWTHNLVFAMFSSIFSLFPSELWSHLSATTILSKHEVLYLFGILNQTRAAFGPIRRHFGVLSRVDEDVEGASCLQQGQKGHRSRDLSASKSSNIHFTLSFLSLSFYMSLFDPFSINLSFALFDTYNNSFSNFHVLLISIISDLS